MKIVLTLNKTFIIDTLKADHTEFGDAILKYYNLEESVNAIDSLDEADESTLHDVVRTMLEDEVDTLIDLQEITSNDFEITISHQTVEP